MVDRVESWAREAEAVGLQAVRDPTGASQAVALLRATVEPALADAPTDPVLRQIRARLRYAEAIIDTHQGRLSEAGVAFRGLLDEYERLEQPRRVADCLNALAVVADRQGDLDDGLLLLERCFQLGNRTGAPVVEQVRVLCNIGVFQARLDDHMAALASFRFAEELLGDENPAHLGNILTSRASLYRSLGRFEPVHELLTTAVALLEPLEPSAHLINALLELAEEELRLGLLGDAEARVAVAGPMAEALGIVLFHPEARIMTARILHARGAYGEADGVLAKALPVATDAQRARLLHLRARGAEADGNLAAALRWTREAHAMELKALETRSEVRVARARARLADKIQQDPGSWRQEALQQARAETRELTRRLEQHRSALAAAAHDLHNPLSVVLLLGELASSEPASLEDSARDIVDAARHMESLVASLLETNRPSPESAAVVVGSVGLVPVIEAAVRRCTPLADSKAHRLRVDVPASLPNVEGDTAALARVLDNLLSNAIKYTPMGGVIRLCAMHIGSQVVIEVVDTGPGLSPSDLDRVFLFPQPLSAKPTNGEPQHGLGLVNVRRLVRKMGGRVRAENHPDGGARFSVMLRTTG